MSEVKSQRAEVAIGEFGIRLREERARLRLTQSATAHGAGVSVPTQIAYEKGLRKPPVSYLTEIEALGFDVHYVRVGIRKERYATDALDWEFFREVVQGVETWCAARKEVLDAWTIVELSRLLYDQMIAEKDVAAGTVNRVLALVWSKR